jgi:hypothetical protein
MLKGWIFVHGSNGLIDCRVEEGISRLGPVIQLCFEKNHVIMCFFLLLIKFKQPLLHNINVVVLYTIENCVFVRIAILLLVNIKFEFLRQRFW